MNFRIVIPSANAGNLRECVKALYRAEPELAPSDILVVDDGALTTCALDAERGRDYTLDAVTWLQGEKPFIFSRNCNIGIVVAAPHDVILLNDDALLTTPGGFTALAQAAEHQEYGVIAAATSSVGNPNQRPHAKGLRLEPRTVCFVCVYIPRRVIDRVGLLDERYIHYGMDDDDYCLRVRNAGWSLGILDDCVMDHSTLHSSYRGKGSGNFKPNMRLFVEKWGADNWGLPATEAMAKWEIGEKL